MEKEAKYMKNAENAGVSSSRIKFCDMRCEQADFPREEGIDGSNSCRTFRALWCKQLNKYVTKNAPCEVIFGSRRPKTRF
jgi:hypothetical protein